MAKFSLLAPVLMIGVAWHKPISPVAANLRMNETLGNPLGLLLS
jgi:hypothetical protein